LAHEWYGNLYLRLRGSDFCPIGVASGSETMRSQKTELACLVEVSCKRAPWFENLKKKKGIVHALCFSTGLDRVGSLTQTTTVVSSA